MVQHGLRERLARRSSTELTVEAERLHDGEVRLDGEHGSSGSLLFAEDLSTALVENGVDTADAVLGTLDLDKVDWLLKTRSCQQASSVADTTAGRNDLTSTTVNCISVKLKELSVVIQGSR